MAESKTGVSRSEEIGKLLKADPKMKAKEVPPYPERTIKIKEAFVDYIEDQMKGREIQQKRESRRPKSFPRMAQTNQRCSQQGCSADMGKPREIMGMATRNCAGIWVPFTKCDANSLVVF